MATQARLLMAPQRPDSDDQSQKVFLAGTTTNTGEPDWRETLTKALSNHSVTILNPSRPDWDRTWKEDFSDMRWSDQIRWELDMQEAADIIVVFFHRSTEAPISLLEFGLAVKMKKVVVCVQEGYRKRGNVEAVCQRFGAILTNTEEELREAVLATLDEQSI
ncbi:hypothetical protein F66182_6239 [Fusarium sp. NRRL 66182]|nr:hypothetical protein F66182_6239 [Fusarium sp. NRRL 66182]